MLDRTSHRTTFERGDNVGRRRNVDEAASPAAILAPGPLKPPLADNDPTKAIPLRTWLGRTVLLFLALGSLVALAVATMALR